MRRLAKLGLRILAGLLLIATLFVVVIFGVLNTEPGSRWVIDTIDARIPGQLQVEQFSGTLWAGLQIPAAEYSDVGQRIRIAYASVDLDWSAIFSGRLVVDRLSASSVEYQALGPVDETPAPLAIDLAPIPVSVGITSGDVTTLLLISGNQQTTVNDIVINNAMLAGNRLRANAASARVGSISVSIADLDSRVTGDVPLRLRVEWRLVGSEWSGRGTFAGTLAALDFNHVLSGPYAATASGELKLLNRIEPQVDALVSWDQWKFGDYELDDGEVRVRGTAADYTGEFDVSLMMPGMTLSSVTGTATGSAERLREFDLRLVNDAGNADVAGSLEWQPSFKADANVRATEFDPSVLVSELAGLLDAEFHIAIEGSDTFQLSDVALSGELNNTEINATGNLGFVSGSVRCDSCRVNVGDNRVSVDGNYGGDSEVLRFSINAPSLETLWPEFSGSLNGTGELVGAATNPRFTGELSGQQLKIAGWSASEIRVKSRASSLDAFDVSATVSSLLVSESELGSFSVSGSGSRESVDVSLDWKFRDLDIRAEGNISRGDSLITASLATASVTEPNTGRWALNDAVLLEIADNRVSVSRHAWTSDVGELQVSRFESNGGDFELEADLVSLPLQFANTFLPENLRLSGTATADIDIRRENEAWIGVINWQQKDTALRILSVNDDPIDVIIPVAELGFDLQNGGALIAAKMTIEPGVVAELDLALAELSSSSNVTAELRLEGREWFWIPALLPTIDNFEGDIAATVRATGPLLSPEFSGSLDWREGSLAIPALNVPISEIDLTMAGTSAGAATVSASAKAGEGDLSVSGRLENMMLPSRSVNMRVRGSSAELINWPEYHVWASPDFIVVGTREGWVFSGSLDVPKAEISVSELSADAVSPSPDIVVVGREETESAAPTRIDGVARLTLGDGVHVTAFGLDTKLRGNLQVRMFKDRPATAEGRVSLVEGTFSAYGQTLSIEEGTLTFTGPLDNPIVDVRAVRTIESLEGAIKAGLHLQGRAQNISSTVYSDPVMSEADALSYVVVGRPLSQATESEGSELSSAALALGVRQAGRITDQIGQSLGLDQLTVAGNGGDTTALVAGKQLNSRLHARYAYGVFSRLGTLLIRYRLSQRLTLEAGAGEAQSIDLLYLVEKE